MVLVKSVGVSLLRISIFIQKSSDLSMVIHSNSIYNLWFWYNVSLFLFSEKPSNLSSFIHSNSSYLNPTHKILISFLCYRANIYSIQIIFLRGLYKAYFVIILCLVNRKYHKTITLIVL